MRKVFLLAGFQNWGKTRLIEGLFSDKRFRGSYRLFGKDTLYNFAGCAFCVIQKSNGDPDRKAYEATYQERMRALEQAGHHPEYIFSAFCPTKEPENQSDEVLEKLYSTDQIVLILIEYKWCGRAKLQLNEIEQQYSALKPELNLSIKHLTESDPAKKLPVLQGIVQSCLPLSSANTCGLAHRDQV